MQRNKKDTKEYEGILKSIQDTWRFLNNSKGNKDKSKHNTRKRTGCANRVCEQGMRTRYANDPHATLSGTKKTEEMLCSSNAKIIMLPFCRRNAWPKKSAPVVKKMCVWFSSRAQIHSLCICASSPWSQQKKTRSETET